MKDIEYWRLCEELTVKDAALLAMGLDPSDFNGTGTYNLPKPYQAISTAILSALKPDSMGDQKILGSYLLDQDGYPSEFESLVVLDSLKSWLDKKGIRRGFFFPDGEGDPDYLNTAHPCYSSKLAAAVSAWLAVTTDKRFLNNGKSPKANLENWLIGNAEKFNLLNDDGEINNTAIKDQISKVVNWGTRGGSPSTPNIEPTPLLEQPTPQYDEDDLEVPF